MDRATGDSAFLGFWSHWPLESANPAPILRKERLAPKSGFKEPHCPTQADTLSSTFGVSYVIGHDWSRTSDLGFMNPSL